MPADGRMGGHLVQGHVDGTGTIRSREPSAHWDVVTIEVPAGAGPLPGAEGLDRRRRRLAHGRRRRRRRRARVHRLAHPHHPRRHHARRPPARRPGQPGGRRDRQVRRAAARAPAPQRRWRDERPAGLAVRRRAADRRPGDPVARDDRQPVRPAVRRRRHAPAGLGVAGRDRRQRAAVHRLRRRGLRHPAGPDAVGPGRAGRSSSSRCRCGAGTAGSRPATPAAPATAARSGRAGRPGASAPSWSCCYAVGTAFFWWLFGIIGSYGRLTEAWILTGSILATYGMARGWVEFWLIWIAVDAVGVPDAARRRLLPVGGAVRLLRAVLRRRLHHLAAGRAGRSRLDPRGPRDPAGGRMTRPARHRRARGRRDRRRPRGRRDRRRGPRERGRPDLRREQGDARADGVHRAPRQRRDLRGRRGRAAGPARDPADDPAQPRADAHRVHGERRRPRRDQHRHQRGRPRPHRPHPRRLGHRAARPGAAGPRVPAALPRGRRAGAARAHRGGRRPGPAGRAHPGRRAVRARPTTTAR